MLVLVSEHFCWVMPLYAWCRQSMMSVMFASSGHYTAVANEHEPKCYHCNLVTYTVFFPCTLVSSLKCRSFFHVYLVKQRLWGNTSFMICRWKLFSCPLVKNRSQMKPFWFIFLLAKLDIYNIFLFFFKYFSVLVFSSCPYFCTKQILFTLMTVLIFLCTVAVPQTLMVIVLRYISLSLYEIKDDCMTKKWCESLLHHCYGIYCSSLGDLYCNDWTWRGGGDG